MTTTAPHKHGANWFKSSYSNGSGGCVEVRLESPAVEVRDTKHRAGGRLQVTDAGWTTLLTGLRRL